MHPAPELPLPDSSLQPSKIQIKGIKEGLLVLLGEGEWSEIRQALLEQLDRQGEFLRGARLALDVGDAILKAVDLGSLRDGLSERGLYLWAVLSNSPTTEQTAQMLGLETRLTKPRYASMDEYAHGGLHGVEEAVMVARTLRSGASVQYPGHVVVIGDVNPGAEIIAGGNVVVWGRLRGLVHAGANGDEGAVVCALDLRPTQLRISDQIALSPKRKGKPQPEIASLRNGAVVAEPWKP
ncbi:MAG: septum site-determining protein MinC [Anaerolineales bacterium]|nr:septum site-determining protein MinC [Anaerolineales bacterium]